MIGRFVFGLEWTAASGLPHRMGSGVHAGARADLGACFAVLIEFLSNYGRIFEKYAILEKLAVIVKWPDMIIISLGETT